MRIASSVLVHRIQFNGSQSTFNSWLFFSWTKTPQTLAEFIVDLVLRCSLNEQTDSEFNLKIEDIYVKWSVTLLKGSSKKQKNATGRVSQYLSRYGKLSCMDNS